MCPGRARSVGRVSGSVNARSVAARSAAEIPVQTRMMTIADIFANPFREAGGSDARLAAAAGAAILTLDRGEVAAVAPADFLGLDTEDYFRRLAALIEAPVLLAALKSHQAEHLDQIGDPEILIANLNKIVRVASDRYEGRGRGAPLSETVFAPPPRLAVAS